MKNEEFADWCADFASVPKSDAELQRWHDSASGAENSEIRQLIAEAQCMRWTARVLFARLQASGGWPPENSQDEALRLAAFFLASRPERRITRGKR